MDIYEEVVESFGLCEFCGAYDPFFDWSQKEFHCNEEEKHELEVLAEKGDDSGRDKQATEVREH